MAMECRGVQNEVEQREETSEGAEKSAVGEDAKLGQQYYHRQHLPEEQDQKRARLHLTKDPHFCLKIPLAPGSN